MKHRIIFGLVLFLLQARLFAAADYFLALEGIPGESSKVGFTDALEILSFNFGVEMPVTTDTTGGTRTGKPVFSEITFAKELGKSSPLLYLNAASGTTLKTATLSLRAAPEGTTTPPFYVVKLTNVLITKVQTTGSAGSGDQPVESFSLVFERIDASFSPVKPDGTLDKPVRSGWDVIANKAF